MPTDRGYRYYVDRLVPRGGGALVPSNALETAVDLGEVRTEVEGALQRLADAISQLTSLLGRRDRAGDPDRDDPPRRGAPVAAATGDRRGHHLHRVRQQAHGRFERPVDPGLVEWAKAVFNERLTGVGVGARTLDARLCGHDA